MRALDGEVRSAPRSLHGRVRALPRRRRPEGRECRGGEHQDEAIDSIRGLVPDGLQGKLTLTKYRGKLFCV